jgi:hypothetical protein
MDGVPESLRAEAAAVEADIRRAFKGVTREGGVSWAGSFVVDDHGSVEEVAAAAAEDTEQSWEELVDDPDWSEEGARGGFNFLDPIGFRYYIAPAMIRAARRGYGENVGFALHANSDFARSQLAEFTPDQSRATARFVKLIMDAEAATGEDRFDDTCKHAWQIYWCKFDF